MYNTIYNFPKCTCGTGMKKLKDKFPEKNENFFL